MSPVRSRPPAAAPPVRGTSGAPGTAAVPLAEAGARKVVVVSHAPGDSQDGFSQSDQEDGDAAPAAARGAPELGFRAVIKEGYQQRVRERDLWFRSLASDDEDERKASAAPVVLVASMRPAACRRDGFVSPKGMPASKLRLDWKASQASYMTLKERSADISEELRRWTQRMSRHDWPPLELC